MNAMNPIPAMRLDQQQIRLIITALLELLLGLVEGNPNSGVVRNLAAKLEFEKLTYFHLQ